jgi:hypothetical protein
MAICGHPVHHMSASVETAIAGQGVVRMACAEVIFWFPFTFIEAEDFVLMMLSLRAKVDDLLHRVVAGVDEDDLATDEVRRRSGIS